MIPVHYLNVQPHHKVLDICASPGSKTKQVIEALHAQVPGSIPGLPQGYVVANEYDPNRAFRLAANLKLLGSPAVMLMNHEGTHLPSLLIGQLHAHRSLLFQEEPSPTC